MFAITISTAFNFYNDHLRSLGRKDRSIEMNNYALDYLLRYLSADGISVDSVTALDRFAIRAFLLWLQNTKKLSGSTAQRFYDVLSALFNFLLAEELIDDSPMHRVEKPRRAAHVIKPLIATEVQAIIDKCDPKTFTGLRNRLTIVVLFDTGMRATELAMVNLEDVDMDQKRILLRHTKGDSPRVTYFSGVVSRLLSKYLLVRENMESHCDRLIVTETGREVDRHWLRIMISRVGAKAGVKVHPHLLRHSCAVESLKNGSDVASVMRLLGHSNPKMTLRYSQLADSDVQEKHRQTSPADRLHLSNSTGRKKLK